MILQFWFSILLDINAINHGNSIVHEAILNDEEFPEKPVLNLLFERRKEFDFNLSPDILFLASSDQIGRVETFELMCEWAYEKRINFGAVDPGGNTILHLACQLKPDLAVFMLENVGTNVAMAIHIVLSYGPKIAITFGLGEGFFVVKPTLVMK